MVPKCFSISKKRFQNVFLFQIQESIELAEDPESCNSFYKCENGTVTQQVQYRVTSYTWPFFSGTL